MGWALKNADALLTFRYIASIVLHTPSVTGTEPDLPVPAYTYIDLTAGYTLPSKTRFQLGVRNLTDKQPPILYQNNVTNANSDGSTYDTIGQQYFVSLSQKFGSERPFR